MALPWAGAFAAAKPIRSTLLLLCMLFTLLLRDAGAQWDCYNPQPGHPTSAEKTAYVNEIKAYAREAESTYGVPAAALLAMACNESGYGWTRIGLYANNLFGWKYYSASAAGGRSYWTLDCQPSWDPNNKYVAFDNRRDCVLFIAMKLSTMSIYKDDTDRYVSDIRSGVPVQTAVDRWVAGIQASGYNPYADYVATTKSYLNNYMSPSSTYSSTYNLYQHSPVTGAVENVWVSIDAPVPQDIVSGNVTFSASVGGGTVDTVKFYSRADGAASWYLINTDTSPPYSCNWGTDPWVADGLYELKAEALDGTTAKAAGIIKVSVDNQATAVAIESPEEGDVLEGTVAISALVAGSGVTSVRFYTRAANSEASWYLLATDTSAPYAANWATDPYVPDGDYYIKTVAHAGTTVVAEDYIAVTVKNAEPQTYWVEFTAPANYQQVSDTVVLAATAAGSPNDNVTAAKFYSRAADSSGSWYLISTDTTKPYQINWTTSPYVPDGSYDLKVEAYAGATKAAEKTIRVVVENTDTTPPAVSFTAPLAGAVVAGDVTLSATASDASGIARVEFYSNGGNYLLGTDTSAPYSLSWATDPWVSNGFQELRVRAYDNAENVKEATIIVTVDNPSGGITLNNGIDNTAIAFSTGGSANWYGDDHFYFTGGDSIRSGMIGHGQSSHVQFTAAGNQTLRFKWRVSSQSGGDYLELWIDGVRKNRISGDTTWASQDWWLPAGTHTVKLQYIKDSSGIAGLDAGWVDYLRLE
ncbi:MAG: large repetitive protein [Candidatus Sumerlaeota bacterium]|nr:large repetitive protein [Candidatus Sumerlaeota bacterium]